MCRGRAWRSVPHLLCGVVLACLPPYLQYKSKHPNRKLTYCAEVLVNAEHCIHVWDPLSRGRWLYCPNARVDGAYNLPNQCVNLCEHLMHPVTLARPNPQVINQFVDLWLAEDFGLVVHGKAITDQGELIVAKPTSNQCFVFCIETGALTRQWTLTGPTDTNGYSLAVSLAHDLCVVAHVSRPCSKVVAYTLSSGQLKFGFQPFSFPGCVYAVAITPQGEVMVTGCLFNATGSDIFLLRPDGVCLTRMRVPFIVSGLGISPVTHSDGYNTVALAGHNTAGTAVYVYHLARKSSR